MPITSDAGTAEARFSIYWDGEIYVEYGASSEWFPLPSTEPPGKLAARSLQARTRRRARGAAVPGTPASPRKRSALQTAT